jgi:hypothetical protein
MLYGEKKSGVNIPHFKWCTLVVTLKICVNLYVKTWFTISYIKVLLNMNSFYHTSQQMSGKKQIQTLIVKMQSYCEGKMNIFGRKRNSNPSWEDDISITKLMRQSLSLFTLKLLHSLNHYTVINYKPQIQNGIHQLRHQTSPSSKVPYIESGL